MTSQGCSNFIKIYLYYRLILKQWNQGCNSRIDDGKTSKNCQFLLTANLGYCAVIEITLLLFFSFYDNWLAAASDTVLLGTLMWIIRLLSSGWISSSCRRHSHSFWSRSARCRSRLKKEKKTEKANCYNRHRSKNIWVTRLCFCQNDTLMGE